ncbi:MAG: acetolactate synthase small subunit [Candidatus Omnitrophota bacterium]|nr:acetolactate synthase small subunit [Candidatus Omnitrophota bacterium]
MKHTISALVENKFGVLARISGLFSARGYNISSLSVSETEDPTISRMTILVEAADEKILEQIKKQLNRLIDVISVVDLTKKEFIEKELVFVKVNSSKENKSKIAKVVNKFAGKILEAKEDYLIIEAVVDQRHLKDFLEELKEFGIKELVRSGRIAITK